MRKLWLAMVSAVIVGGSSFVATGQNSSFYNSIYQGNARMRQLYSTRATMGVGKALRRSSGNRTSAHQHPLPPAGRPGGTTGNPAALAPTTFKPVSASIIPAQLSAEAGKTASDRAEMEKFFAHCLQNYESNMRRQGQPVKDVARAVSYLIGVSFNVYHGGNALTPGQGAALRADIKDALAADGQFQQLSNREKQEMYETMAVLAEYVAISADVAAQKGNQQLAAMAREMAKDNLEKLLGSSINDIRITDNGLEF